MMSFDKKWAVILISSTLLSAINTSPSILPLGHADVHHHPAQHLPVTYDHEPHPIHPASPAHGKDHHHEKHPLPLSHDPYKHDHHHYKDPYVSKHNILTPLPKTLLNEISEIAIIEKSRPSDSVPSVIMDDPYLVAHKSGPPYLTIDELRDFGNHGNNFLSTKSALDPPYAPLLNEISLISRIESPRTIKSHPLVLRNPHAFKEYIGKQNILNPPPEYLRHNIPSHLNIKKPHQNINSFPSFPRIIGNTHALPLVDTFSPVLNNHDPHLVDSFAPVDEHGFQHDHHNHHYDHYNVRNINRNEVSNLSIP
jgi:hypothetical protein